MKLRLQMEVHGILNQMASHISGSKLQHQGSPRAMQTSYPMTASTVECCQAARDMLDKFLGSGSSTSFKSKSVGRGKLD